MLNDKMIFERYIKAGNTLIYPDLISLLYLEEQERKRIDNTFNNRIDSALSYYQELGNGSYNTYDYQAYLISYDQFQSEINTLYQPTDIPLEFDIFIEQLCAISREKDLFLMQDSVSVKYIDYKSFPDDKKIDLHITFPELRIKLYPFRSVETRVILFREFSATGIPGYGQIWGDFIPYILYLNVLSKITSDYINKYITTDINFLKKYSNMEANATLFFNNRNTLESKIDILQTNPSAVENFKDLVKMVKDDLDILAKHRASVVNKLESKQDVVIKKTSPQMHLSEEYYSANELIYRGHSILNTYVIDNPDYDGSKIFQIVYELYIDKKEINLREIGSYYNNKIYK